jgi:16S rRNA (uracil1498-N3)-methyltransferase
MRISRIYTDQRLEAGGRAVLDGKRAGYVVKVLRLRPGDSLVLFNGDGADYAAKIVSPRRDSVELAVSTKLPAVAEPELRIMLVQAIARGERMDYCLQKATELGVAAVQPVFTERVEVRLDGPRLEKRMDHWRGVIVSACEQSGRAVVPALLEPLVLDAWMASDTTAPRMVLDPVSDQSLAGQTIASAEIEILVGPEGGFSRTEMARLRSAGTRPVALGPRVLRTETAGPAAIAVLQAIAGDF